MKKMVCEICGSNNIEKKDGVFVCNSCGTRYSLEEAKKLLVEVSGKVEVSGSVKVDNADRLENLYKNARRARNAGNYEEAAKYYDYILIDDSNSWEANFYSVFSKAMSCKIAEISSYAVLVANSFPEVLRLIKNSFPPNKYDSVVKEVSTQVNSLYEVMVKNTYDFYLPYFDYSSCANDLSKCCTSVGSCGNAIATQFADNNIIVRNAIPLWKSCIKLCNDLLEFRPSLVDPYVIMGPVRNDYWNLINNCNEQIERTINPEAYRAKKEAEAREKREQRKAQQERDDYLKANPQIIEKEKIEKDISDKSTGIMIGVILILIGAFIVGHVIDYKIVHGFILGGAHIMMAAGGVFLAGFGLFVIIQNIRTIRANKKRLEEVDKKNS